MLGNASYGLQSDYVWVHIWPMHFCKYTGPIYEKLALCTCYMGTRKYEVIKYPNIRSPGFDKAPVQVKYKKILFLILGRT